MTIFELVFIKLIIKLLIYEEFVISFELLFQI